MARAKKTTETTRRGHPEAIAKRRAARALNRLFSEAGAATAQLDGRSLKRKQRLMKELVEGGEDGQPLKALEVLSHAHELLSLGETLVSLRKLKPKLPPMPPIDETTAAVIRDTQANYSFDTRAWKLLRVDLDRLPAPGTKAEAEAEAPPRPRRKARAKKKAPSKTRRRSA
ncbi:MAG: hypothetical protein KC619_09285 [Myxococcales bacterium]|nr:hypothetical protein [Myxococcales bacterium]